MYRIFLFFIYKYPNEVIIPFKEVDEFWYNHILFTKKYHDDCKKIFGQYLHQQPGGKSQTKRDFYRTQYQKTVALAKKEFPSIV